jgi:hypothetical protein
MADGKRRKAVAIRGFAVQRVREDIEAAMPET